jgi:flagellar hook-length control protein FliK
LLDRRGIEILTASEPLPQQLANLLLSARRPDIQPSTREAKNVEPRSADKSGGKSDTFARTLDRQLDRQQPTRSAEQTQPVEKPPAPSEAAATTTSTTTEDSTSFEDVAAVDAGTGEEISGKEANPAQAFAINTALINTPETASFKAANLAQATSNTPGQNAAPGTPLAGEILPETAPKEAITGKITDQKSATLTPTSDLFTKELAAINAPSGSKIISEEANAQLAKQSDEAKSDKKAGGLLQKALSEISSLQNGSAKIAPNATAFANANANANFLAPTDTSGIATDISQNLEQLTVTAQNGNTVSVKLGAAIQSNQSAQTAINSLAVQIARNVDLGINRFQIRMDPPELGRIDVKLEFGKDGRMTANLSVERPETLDLLVKDARALERALAGSGLNTDGDSLNFSLKDQSANEFADFAQDSESNSDTAQDADDESVVNSPLDQTIAAYRSLISSTAVDIRI